MTMVSNPSTKHQAPSTKHQAPSTKHQAPTLWRFIVGLLALLIACTVSNTANAQFSDEFDGAELQSIYWSPGQFNLPSQTPGIITVSGGTVTFGAWRTANTENKATFSGDKIVIEARFAGLGSGRDTHIDLIDTKTGDYISAGESNYWAGLYLHGSGSFGLTPDSTNTHPSVNTFKEYRVTVDGTSFTIERGDTLANITETKTRKLATTIAGKTFYLRIGTASTNHSPGTFDWIRVTNGNTVTETPIISANPTNLLFGQQPVGQATQKTVTLTNTGTGTLDIGALNLNGDADFTFDTNSCNNAHLVKDATCQFTVAFNPAVAGSKQGYVVVPSNGVTASDLQIGLTGEGIAVDTSADLGIALTLAPKTMDANNTTANYRVSFLATNNGPATAKNATVSITLPNGISLNSVLPTGCTRSGSTVKCTDTSFAVGDTLAPSFKIQASTAAIGSNPKISATISSDNTDKNSANNKAVTAAIGVGSVVQVNVPKAGTGVGTVMGNFGNSGINCGTTCTATVKFPLASGGSITLTAKAGLRSKLTTWSGPDCKSRGAQPTCTIKVQSGGTYSIGAIFEQLPSEKVVLLLHGMNSEPSVWSDFVKKDKNFKPCNSIYNGVIIDDGIAGIKDNKPITKPLEKKQPTNHGLFCYAVRFGAYDNDKTSLDTGLLDVIKDKNGKVLSNNAKDWAENNNVRLAGDFSDFDELGKEIQMALQAISVQHPGAHLTLIGHSRGGLAARAFLSSSNSQAQQLSKYVDTLITTGTPHHGSPIGKIYAWLKNPNHSRVICEKKSCNNDWKAIDFLKTLLKTIGQGLDARRPTINYLASNSAQILKLDKGTIPNNIVTGQIRYAGSPIGQLTQIDAKGLGVIYDIFPKGRNGLTSPKPAAGFQLSIEATNDILGSATTNADNSGLLGDGIVPVNSQSYKAKQDLIHGGNIVLHTEEPSEVSDINAMMCRLGLTQWVLNCS